jgi:hypothetical protein
MTTVPPPTEPTSPAAPTEPRPVSGLGTGAVALLVLTMLALVPMFISSWSDYTQLSDHVSGRLSDDEYWEQYSGRYMSSLVLTMPVLPLGIAATATWLVWVYRARTNAALISPHHRFRYSPGFSVGGLVVPLANLWFSRPILEDVCIGSSPRGTADPTVRLVRTWWGLVIAGYVVPVIGRIATPVQTITYTPDGRIVDGSADALSAFLTVALIDTVLMFMAVAGGLILVTVIRRVTRQQTEQLFAARPA